MDYLQNLLENTHYSFVTALVLGLMTAISPCPLATNISAIGFISRDIEDKRRVFVSGLVYTLGRAVSYTALAVVLFLGANQLDVSLLFQGWGEKLLGPLLLVIGLFMLNIINLKLPGFHKLTDKLGENSRGSYWSTLLLGMVFALAFCPYSGVLYFAMLIPMTITSASGLYLPVVFAIATGLPVIMFAWLLAYAIGRVSNVYNRIKNFEIWFRRIVATMFMIAGLYYIVIFFV